MTNAGVKKAIEAILSDIGFVRFIKADGMGYEISCQNTKTHKHMVSFIRVGTMPKAESDAIFFTEKAEKAGYHVTCTGAWVNVTPRS